MFLAGFVSNFVTWFDNWRLPGFMACCGVFASGLANAQEMQRPWLDPALLDAARGEASVTVYSTTNEEEGLPLWRIFETATGLKVNFVRASDSALLARVLIENRAGQRSWDVLQTANVNKIPAELLLEFTPPEASRLSPQAIDPGHRWYGVYANYNTPAYNTQKLRKQDLPRTYDELATRKDLAGRVAIDATDDAWMTGMLRHYGEAPGLKLLNEIVAVTQPVAIDGHLAVARAVGSGEYLLALNNYLNLTINVRLGGGPTDFFALDPVVLFFGQVGVSKLAPHPNAARLAAYFAISAEAQTFLATFGRLPTRPDVATHPPGILEALAGKKIVTVLLDTEEDRRRIRQFNSIFKPR